MPPFAELKPSQDPAVVGLCPERWTGISKQAAAWCAADAIPAISYLMGKESNATEVVRLGRQQVNSDKPLATDSIFLVASITKPIVGTAVLQLLEQGELMLNDKVRKFIPEFKGTGKNSITLRHLLTHSSGLPDMLPNDFDLRNAHAPLSRFIEGICQADLLFTPGESVSYQSMGFCLLGEVIQRITSLPCADYLHQSIFAPLQMHDTALGAPDNWYEGDKPKANRIAEIRLPETQLAANWNWNEKYWQSLGAPWGGLLTTPEDLSRFAAMMLNEGHFEDATILSPATVRVATTNQLNAMIDMPEKERRCRPWGLGWKLTWPGYSAHFGDLHSPNTFGHWGSTGTLLWMDPENNSFGIILCTEPQEPHGPYLARMTNRMRASIR
ncbi:Penicillin-binding protein 4* [Polystyrenella longa]|uniref:Penicillin-binding protein 4 n=1 Tax=Polystyrenella longa TaxID=2528007 RepID=A0A518CHN8_9PLAN|nr:serine hydrolase domain-containing protein [Polystyrenella longa]QDU78684.1 Penicillin-binding protein 4* [Polystyrenella longa]